MKKLTIIIMLILILSIFVIADTFIDNTQSEFDSGTYDQTFYNTTNELVQLNISEDFLIGNYTSQIFNANTLVQWDNISWVQEICYQCELPANQAIETGDFVKFSNMTENVLLMHLNEASGTIIDSSGLGNDGTNLGGTYGANGKFNTAIRFSDSGDRIEITDSSSLDIIDNITISLWVNLATTTHSSWNYFIYHKGDTKYELGIYDPDMEPRFKPYNDDGSSFEIAANPITTNTWYHIVAIRDGTSVRLYVNSIQEASRNDFTGSLQSTTDVVRIGGNSGSSYLNGTIDEVAIFNRTLSATEITNLYKRGALKLNLTVRSCDDDTCVGENFKDIDNVSPQDLNVTNNTYFQYKFKFETDNKTYSPELYNVTINYAQLSDTISPTISNALINDTSPIPLNTIIKVNATVTDDTSVSSVTIQVDPPNDPPYNITASNSGSEYFNNTALLSQIGQWVFTFFANDTSANNATPVIAQDSASNNYIEITDQTPPTISNITETIIQTTATIAWITDELANSSIPYNTTQELGSIVSSSALVTSHSLDLTGLNQNTLYYYNITSCDSSNNCLTNGTFNFTTLEEISSPGDGGSGGGGGSPSGGGGTPITTIEEETPQESSQAPSIQIPTTQAEPEIEQVTTEEPEIEEEQTRIIPLSSTVITILALIIVTVIAVYEERKFMKRRKAKIPKKKKRFFSFLKKKPKIDSYKQLEKAGFKVKKSTKSAQLLTILQELKKIGNIEGASAISREGLIIASNISTKTGAEKFSATSALMIKSAETALSKLNKGNLNHIILNTKTRKVIATTAGKKAILVCLIKPRGNLGLMLLEIKKIANKISKTLE